MPRVFVAVPLPEPARRAVVDLVAGVRADVDSDDAGRNTAVRWVRMEGIHLTLRFLGPVSPDQVAPLADLVDDLAGNHRPIAVGISGGGAFPTPQRPRTLWLAVTRGDAALTSLAADLSARLEGAGWPPDERPLRLHVTLARADGRRAGPATAAALMRHAAGFDLEFMADRLTLFESITGGGPARYVPLHEAQLRGASGGSETPR
jgi:RNA 2',3'-cyclic 3'-phosphodiesterase